MAKSTNTLATMLLSPKAPPPYFPSAITMENYQPWMEQWLGRFGDYRTPPYAIPATGTPSGAPPGNVQAPIPPALPPGGEMARGPVIDTFGRPGRFGVGIPRRGEGKGFGDPRSGESIERGLEQLGRGTAPMTLANLARMPTGPLGLVGMPVALGIEAAITGKAPSMQGWAATPQAIIDAYKAGHMSLAEALTAANRARQAGALNMSAKTGFTNARGGATGGGGRPGGGVGAPGSRAGQSFGDRGT